MGIVLLGGTPVAEAQPSDPPYPSQAPSQAEVDAARQEAQQKARGVEVIQAEYAAAGQELESLGIAAAQAAEAYNGALWRLQQARADARAAQRKARRAAVRTDRQRDGIGALVAETYQGASDLGQVRAYLAASDPNALLDRFAAFKGASATMQARLDRFEAAHTLGVVFRREAARAVSRADRAEQHAAAARQNAQAAVAAQQAAVTHLADRRDALVDELARAQSISVALAAQRQQALERQAELRRQRAAARAAERARERAAAAAAQRAEEARAAREAREAAEEKEAAQARAEAREARARAREAREAQDEAAAREARARARAAAQDARAEQRARAQQRAARLEAERAGAEARQAGIEARQARIEARRARVEARQQRLHRIAERREARRKARQEQARRAQSAAGGQPAVAFAMAQLGEPYVWGGAGPDVWDCSGLTAAAWGSAGRYLSHYSVAQYYETTRVGYADLRPGDLIFWSSNGSPSGIFHVAMYLGNDQMVHAPRTGVPVKVENVWYWQAPDFFGRV